MLKKPLGKKKVPLPKGFKAAPPIKNKKLRELVMQATSRSAVGLTRRSGGFRLLSDSQPIVDR